MTDPVTDQLRNEIALRDRAILDAINERLELVAELKRHKQKQGIDFVDPEQEERVLARLEAANAGRLSSDGLRRLFTEILDLTKSELD